MAGSWLLLERWWITAPVALLVLGWWGLFLVVVPYTTPVKESETLGADHQQQQH